MVNWSLTFDSSTSIRVQDVEIVESRRYAIAILGSSYVTTLEDDTRCDTFTVDPYVFTDLWTADFRPEDPRVVDFRVFIEPPGTAGCPPL